MMKFALLIFLLCTGLTACTYPQRGALPYQVDFRAKFSMLKKKTNGSNEFFPITFGSGFMIIDESLLTFE